MRVGVRAGEADRVPLVGAAHGVVLVEEGHVVRDHELPALAQQPAIAEAPVGRLVRVRVRVRIRVRVRVRVRIRVRVRVRVRVRARGRVRVRVRAS